MQEPQNDNVTFVIGITCFLVSSFLKLCKEHESQWFHNTVNYQIKLLSVNVYITERKTHN